MHRYPLCCILYQSRGWLVKASSVTTLNPVLPQTKSSLPGAISGFVNISIWLQIPDARRCELQSPLWRSKTIDIGQ